MSDKEIIGEHVVKVAVKVSEYIERPEDRSDMALMLIPMNNMAPVLYKKTVVAYM